MSRKPDEIETRWQVSAVMTETTITFDTEENARTYWLANQPSLLTRVTEEHWISGELAALLPTPAQEG